MKALQSLRFLLILACGVFLDVGIPEAVAQQQSVSSDDISIAEGLQLPTYGHVWALDTWNGLPELVRLKPPGASSDDTGFSLKMKHAIEFKGEAATVRIHQASPFLFLRGVSGEPGRSDLVVVRLGVEDQRRVVSKDAMAQLKQLTRHSDGNYPDVVTLKQQRVGSTDWYRITPTKALTPGEYVLIPLSSSQGFAESEYFDFAVDFSAPENADPLRSEQYRGAETKRNESDQ